METLLGVIGVLKMKILTVVIAISLLLSCKETIEPWTGLDEGYDNASGYCIMNGIEQNLKVSIYTTFNKSIVNVSIGKKYGGGVAYVNSSLGEFSIGSNVQNLRDCRFKIFVEDAHLFTWDLDTLAENYLIIDSISSDSNFVKGRFQLAYTSCCYAESGRMIKNAPELANDILIKNGTFEGNIWKHY